VTAPSGHRLDGGRPIGQVLVDAGLITRQQLADALAQQRRTGGRIGKLLILQGVISRRELYSAVADQLGFPLVDLLREPPDAELMAGLDARQQLTRDWIPYRLDKDLVTVATSEPPSRRMIREAQEQFAVPHVDFVISTDWDMEQAISSQCRGALLFNAAEELAALHPDKSAKGKPVPWQRIATYLIALGLVTGLIMRPAQTVLVVLVVLNVAFLVAILFKTVTTLVGLLRMREERLLQRALREAGIASSQRGDDADLPIYTILVPVFREANVVELVLEHMGHLDWPKSKLQVLILTEEEDVETIEACKAAQPPEFVRIVVVPRGTPQTKPRACNYGLMFALGEYLVIYDAEDRPDPDQLRNAHAAFLADQAEPDQSRPLACVQAALNYFNWRANLLTRLFTLEYSSWFDGMLYGMEFFRLPIPLGGTSNHFRTDRLRELGGWDPYNVTEDADLGMRASAAGYRVGTIESTTWEEACSRIPAFIRQRTRWLKGYIITALVDLRYPIRFTRMAGARSLFTLVGLIAGTPFLFLAYPVVWGITIYVFLGFETFGLTVPDWLGALATVNAVGGNIVILTLAMITGAVRHGWRISGYALLNPVYWILHAVASWRALWQVFFQPFHWEKTPHGLTHAPDENAAVR
jgi:cellulose synthase/poly-beta-1,6-N-acetylglucosamine synthase-like glycosyltransferase